MPFSHIIISRYAVLPSPSAAARKSGVLPLVSLAKGSTFFRTKQRLYDFYITVLDGQDSGVRRLISCESGLTLG